MMRICIGVLSLCSMLASGATVTAYYSSGAFLGAAGSTQTFGFGEADGTQIASLDSAAAVATAGGNAYGAALIGGLCGSSPASNIDCFVQLVFTLTPGIKAFGLEDIDLTTDEEMVMTVALSNGDPAQTYIQTQGGAALTPQFLGVVSDADIASVSFYTRDLGSSQTPGMRALTVDNVVLGAGGQTPAAAVPEPASILLTGIGLLALAAVARRR